VRIRPIALLPLLALACTSAATRTPSGAPRPEATVLGVVPFQVAARDTLLEPLSYGLAELLATDLARSQRLTLVERARLGEVLRELDLASSGAVDSTSAPRVGRLLEARRLVLGALRRAPSGDVLFQARVSDVATGRIDTALVATAPLADVLAAEKAIAFRLFDQLDINLTPEERARVAQVPTRNLGALVAYGQGVKAEVNGQYAAAYRAFRRAARLDPAFRAAVERAGTLSPAVATAIGATTTVVDRVNRPSESVPMAPPRGLATDPGFPSTVATLIITITRPRIQ
jgi:TolB-like protein